MRTDKSKLIHAVTQYDIRQSKKQGHNPYALAQYFASIEQVFSEVKGGINIIVSIEDNFNKPLSTILIKALDQETK